MCLVYRRRVLSIIVDIKALVYSGLAPGGESKWEDWGRIMI